MSWTIVIVLIALYSFYELYWKRRNLPPGPTPLPLIGNLIAVMRDFPGFNKYEEWKKQYGPIYTYWCATTPVVTVNNYKLVQEMFVNDGETYADRPEIADISKKYRGGEYGLIETSGPIWREQRRFTLHTLRDLGLGKEEMQERILMEADYLLTKLEEEVKEHGKINPIPYLDRTVASLINLVIFGYRFDEDSAEEYFRIRGLLDKQNKELSDPALWLFFIIPKIGEWIPYAKRKFDLMYHVRDELYAMFEKNIKNHREIIDYESEDFSDYCEAYLKEMHKQKDDPETTFHDKQFINVCLDLWSAGIETTSVTMAWGIALLLNYPQVLKKLHDEYDKVIGSDRLITVKDKTNLPYTNAFINELQRWANIVPQNLTRKTNKDVNIDGHSIKKGTTICPQVSTLLYDPEVFPDPHTFNPERHLDEDEKLISYKQLLPFSVGRRQCPGEGLARMELFLFFANLTHRFNLSSSDPLNPPSLQRTYVTAGKPAPFECTITRRHV